MPNRNIDTNLQEVIDSEKLHAPEIDEMKRDPYMYAFRFTIDLYKNIHGVVDLEGIDFANHNSEIKWSDQITKTLIIRALEKKYITLVNENGIECSYTPKNPEKIKFIKIIKQLPLAISDEGRSRYQRFNRRFE